MHVQVVIDDLLPVDGYCNILGSYSNSRDEFWVSLLEKAYMKVWGVAGGRGLLHCNRLWAGTTFQDQAQ